MKYLTLAFIISILTIGCDEPQKAVPVKIEGFELGPVIETDKGELQILIDNKNRNVCYVKYDAVSCVAMHEPPVAK